MPDYAILRSGGVPHLIERGDISECGDYDFAATPAEALDVARVLSRLQDSPGPVIASAGQLAGFQKIPSAFVRTLSRITDKTQQGYMPVYERIAAELGPAAAVCEIGVWFGGSLATWQSLFPDGIIAGVDIDPESVWPDGTVKIVAGQDDEDLPGKLLEISPDGFDLIVDDASHEGKLTRRTWELLWPLVRPGGYYVIEDWFVGLGHHPWEAWGDSMLRTAESFLPLLHQQDGDPEEITYRYGMVIMHRKTP